MRSCLLALLHLVAGVVLAVDVNVVLVDVLRGVVVAVEGILVVPCNTCDQQGEIFSHHKRNNTCTFGMPSQYLWYVDPVPFAMTR